MTKEEEREYDQHWHVDRKIPIAIIATLVLQTTGIVWWASNLSTRLDHVERFVLTATPQADRLTRVEVKLENIERGVTRIESSILARQPPVAPLIAR